MVCLDYNRDGYELVHRRSLQPRQRDGLFPHWRLSHRRQEHGDLLNREPYAARPGMTSRANLSWLKADSPLGPHERANALYPGDVHITTSGSRQIPVRSLGKMIIIPFSLWRHARIHKLVRIESRVFGVSSRLVSSDMDMAETFGGSLMGTALALNGRGRGGATAWKPAEAAQPPRRAPSSRQRR